MATIPQKNLFSWKEISAASDLERLRLVIDTVSCADEELMSVLESARGKGRDEYPV